MNPKWLIVLSVSGIFVGLFIFLDTFIFYVWGCFDTYFGPCQPPFSYYLYQYYLPIAIIGFSSVILTFGLKRRATMIRTGKLGTGPSGSS